MPLKRGPFYAVGKRKEGYSLVLAGQVVSPEKYKTIEAAQKAVDEKGWDLIFIATAVYRDAWETQNRPKKSKKTWQSQKHSGARDLAPATK